MTLSKFMKNKYIATLVAAATLVLTGCSNDIDNNTEDITPTDNIVRFDIGVQDDMGTRAIYNSDNLKTRETYIYFENNCCTGFINYENDRWVGDRDGTGYPLIWKDMNSPTDVIATCGNGQYTKNKEGKHVFTVFFPKDQLNEGVPDFLFFMTKDFVPSSNNGEIAINFKHKLSLVDIVVKFESAQASNPISNLKLGGTITDIKEEPTNFEAGIPLLEAADRQYKESTDLITPQEIFNSNSPSVTYECSVIPQTVAKDNLTVTFNMNGKEYTWSSTKDLTFSEGKRNTITITLN